jgi:hypothetical protein
MGIRVRKSFKVAPGVRVNVGNKSSSVTVGNKYGRATISTSGDKRSKVHRHTSSHQQPASPRMLKIGSVIMWIIGILALLLALVGFSTAGAAGLFFLIIAIPCIILGYLWGCASKQSRNE